ncbi:MAG: hypothetical protein JXK07_07170 [Spirochaetes bacterium]|nr:hypothetical protein [Spirochaetota bacterium]MBN2769634.1 hypothetical protein [Spirochaetota bacterium]
MSNNRSKINKILVRQAYRSLSRGSLVEAVGCLEQVAADKISKTGPYVDYLLAVAYLKSDRLAPASELVRNALRRYPEYAPFKEILAYLAIKSGTSREQVIGPIIQYEQEYTQSRKIRKLHKKLLSCRDFEVFQRKLKFEECITLQKPPKSIDTLRYKRDLPCIEFTYNFRKILFSAVTVIFVASVAFFVFNTIFDTSDSSEVSTEHFRLDNHRYPLIDTASGESRFTYKSENDLLSDYEKSRGYIKTGKHNDALLLLNRIMLSNVNISVKDRVVFLKDFIRRVEKKSYDKIDFVKLKADPELYNGFYIIMSGKVANFKSNDESSAFTLLVNEKNDNFDAVAQVIMDGTASVENGVSVTVKGEFLKSADDGGIIIKADNVIAD